jgi:hypothetical protein
MMGWSFAVPLVARKMPKRVASMMRLAMVRRTTRFASRATAGA